LKERAKALSHAAGGYGLEGTNAVDLIAVLGGAVNVAWYWHEAEEQIETRKAVAVAHAGS
jgi:hypothetical protein